jgi:lipoprotein signal peptidase
MPIPDSPPDAGPASHHHSAIVDPRAHLRLWSVAAAGLAFDLWSKSWAFSNLKHGEVREFIPSVLSFRLSTNAGALFGMGKGLVPLFIVASFVALGVVLYLFASSAYNRKSLHLALSFILAGSLGNLHDRALVIADQITITNSEDGQPTKFIGKVVEDDGESDFVLVGIAPDGASPRPMRRADLEISPIGVVRDFLKFEPVGGFDYWPWVFNVADALLVAGVILLMLNFWFERKLFPAPESPPTEPQPS